MASNLQEENRLLWKPAASNELLPIDKFTKFINDKYQLSLGAYPELHAFSIQDISRFWQAVWDYCRVVSSSPHSTVVSSTQVYPPPKWFVGAKMNWAENMLHAGSANPARDAIIGCSESGILGSVTWAQLALRVGQCAHAMASHGVGVGDRVAGYVPNSIEAAIWMLATASLGAIWSSASPDFGVTGVVERFSQVEPVLLVSTPAVEYNGRIHSHLEKLAGVVQGLPSVRTVVLFATIQPLTAQDCEAVPKSVLDVEFLADSPLQPPVYAQLPFEHPLIIVFSSGTTGAPKCITHCHGGAVLQHAKEHVIHGGMGADDVFFYYTTTGWMMWNWLLSGLGTGATIVLYDGSPFKPTPDRLWELSEALGVTHLGVSAKYIQALEEAGVVPMQKFNLSKLKILYSTGSPLKLSSYDYIYNSVKLDVCVGSITGGTDIISLFCGHNVSGRVYRGEIQCVCLGMAVEAWDEDGKRVHDAPGDLVCTKPFPVMPVGFWNDADGQKYYNAYFSTFKGFWYHGDYLSINSKTGGVVMLGRSDGTLNPNGVRFGSSELYNVMTHFPEIQDSLAVGQKVGVDERVVMFCKMADGKHLDSALINAIKARIRELLSPRHVPAVILPIADIPYTLTGKKVEVAVKKIVNGQAVKSTTSLANPESLELYHNIRELLSSSL